MRNPRSRTAALEVIRGIESNPRTFAEIILRRHIDPRWAALQEAYRQLNRHSGIWLPVAMEQWDTGTVETFAPLDFHRV